MARRGATAVFDRADAVDQLVAKLIGEEGWELDLESVIGALQDFVHQAGSLEELRERLAGGVASTDARILANGQAPAGFAARLAGETGAAAHEDEEA